MNSKRDLEFSKGGFFLEEHAHSQLFTGVLKNLEEPPRSTPAFNGCMECTGCIGMVLGLGLVSMELGENIV
jgi:hypothetical protein